MKQQESISLWRNLFAIVDSLREHGSPGVESNIANMTFNQLRMIKFVYTLNREYPEGVTLKILAESLSITPAAASEMVDALVRKDLLKRDHNPQDRRAVAITLSPTIKRRFQDGERLFDQLANDFLATLTPEERESYIRKTVEFAAFLKQH